MAEGGGRLVSQYSCIELEMLSDKSVLGSLGSRDDRGRKRFVGSDSYHDPCQAELQGVDS